ncbi:MAG: hypothetical protein Fur0012_06160 [Elusimicrobiota bacterium]
MIYIKLFSAGFAILFFMHLIVFNYKPHAMLESLVYGFFGGISFMIIGVINFISAKAAGLPPGETLKVNYEHEEIKTSSAQELKEHLKNFYSGRKMHIEEEGENFIVFRTPISFKTLGTVIDYRFSALQNSLSVKVSTRPALKTIILDYGASYKEFNLAKQALKTAK